MKLRDNQALCDEVNHIIFDRLDVAQPGTAETILDAVDRHLAAALSGHLQGEARPRDEWHEDIGPVLWWKFPVVEPPYSGTPLDCDDFPDYVTHWTRIVVPGAPTSAPTVPATTKEGR